MFRVIEGILEENHPIFEYQKKVRVYSASASTYHDYWSVLSGDCVDREPTTFGSNTDCKQLYQNTYTVACKRGAELLFISSSSSWNALSEIALIVSRPRLVQTLTASNCIRILTPLHVKEEQSFSSSVPLLLRTCWGGASSVRRCYAGFCCVWSNLRCQWSIRWP